MTEFLTKRLITHYLDPWFSEHYSKFTDSLFLRLGDLSALFSDFIPSLHSQYIKHHLEIFTLFKPQWFPNISLLIPLPTFHLHNSSKFSIKIFKMHILLSSNFTHCCIILSLCCKNRNNSKQEKKSIFRMKSDNQGIYSLKQKQKAITDQTILVIRKIYQCHDKNHGWPNL